MIITVKNLQQQTFTIDFDPEKTVLELKKQIFEERGAEYFVEKQKLIYAGVILTDERTISSYKVDEKKFIVVMLSRDVIITSSSTNADAQRKHNELTESSITEAEKKPVIHNTNVSSNQKEIKTKTTSEILGVEVESTGAGSSATTQTSTAAPVPLDTGSTAAITDYSSIDLVGELANASIQTRAESNLLMGEEFNRTVASMVEMGYPREQVERAMAASFNNPERAVEYLVNGIPQDENLFNPGDEEEPNRAERNRRQGGENDLLTESAADPFEFLRSQPQFLQMRSLIYQNPHLLHAVLQQIGQTNPALLQLISENQDAFLNMLNQPLDDETGDNAQRVGRTLSSTSGRTESSTTANFIAEVNADGQRSAPSSDDQSIAIATESDDSVAAGRNIQTENLATIRLTPHDQDAIERLKALGFPEALVLQAYFACEKDEELAANFLLSSSFDD